MLAHSPAGGCRSSPSMQRRIGCLQPSAAPFRCPVVSLGCGAPRQAVQLQATQQPQPQPQHAPPMPASSRCAGVQQADEDAARPPALAAAAAAAAAVLPTPTPQQSAAAAAAAAAAAGSSQRLAAAIAVLLAVRQRWRRLAAWCRQHRVRQLLFGSADGGMAMAAAAAVPLLPGNGLTDLFTNRVFLVGFWAWFTAQTLKIFTKYLKKGVWDLRAIVDSGGMPSSHSALCAGITTAIAYQHGMGSSAFALAVALSSIVMYDAAGVRRHAGKQAEVLNQVIGELLEGHPVSDVKLKEVLGHTPLQVACGAVLGVLFGIWFPTPDNMAAAAQHLLTTS